MSQERQASADPGYKTQPLEAPGVSGYLPQGGHRRRDPFARVVAREPRLVVPMRDVQCYECGKNCQIPVAALSAVCPHCFAHLSTANVTVKPGTHHLQIHTLGDVKIPECVELSRLHVVCHNLTIAGCVKGTLRATGILTLQGRAELEGQLTASKLIVAGGARAQVRPGISVDEAELSGSLSGRLYARGEVHIRHSGKLDGDCRATSLRLDHGAVHIGTRELIKR